MTKFRLGKSLDTQLKEQGFVLAKVGEGLNMDLSGTAFSPKQREENEWYLAPFYVVGLKEEDYDLKGKGYALYARTKDRR